MYCFCGWFENSLGDCSKAAYGLGVLLSVHAGR